MPVAPSALPAALRGLDQVLDVPLRPGVAQGTWRWQVRRQATAVRAALMQEVVGSDDGWLAARGGAAFRERTALLTRLGELATTILQTSEVEATRHELKRLVVDVQHHLQRLHDLAYDEVELELGDAD